MINVRFRNFETDGFVTAELRLTEAVKDSNKHQHQSSTTARASRTCIVPCLEVDFRPCLHNGGKSYRETDINFE